jgi:hypothetical protein
VERYVLLCGPVLTDVYIQLPSQLLPRCQPGIHVQKADTDTPQPGNFFSFNPSTLISLGDGNTVYPTFHAVARWGTLDVKDGVRIPTDFSSTTLAAPKDTAGPHLQGPGWTIDLAPGWTVVRSPGTGNYVLQH